jgi:sulfite reductase (ferredoxin)
MSADTPPDPAKPARSGVEVVKENSRALRGGIAAELARDSDHFSEADKNLLKFHGTYQQEDRDARKTRRQGGLGKHIVFMVRCKIPGGRVSADQYLALDRLADRHANGTLRFTSRQGIQFHGVLKSDLHATIAGVNATLLTTLGACGDVNRNVMACPAPLRSDRRRLRLQADAARLAAHFAPRTRAYHEIWLNGQAVSGAAEADGAEDAEAEAIYGKAYLPRKFKMGLTLPEDNCVDVYGQDLGLLGCSEGGALAGYNLLVGGGMGMTHGKAETFPYLAKPICYVEAEELIPAAEAVVKLFRDHGNRADRKRARIKYLVHDWGVERFREVLAGYLRRPPALPRPLEVAGSDLHLGAHPQGDGRWWYGISVESGRVKDDGPRRLRSCLRALVERFRPELRLTPSQDVLLCGLEGAALPAVEAALTEHGVPRPEEVSPSRRLSLACPAIPTCGLAISESERALPGLLDELEAALREEGLDGEAIGVRMTGCPNGCARPYQSDVGVVGRSGDKYTLYVGGHPLGHRLNFPLRDLTPRADIMATLRPLLRRFKEQRRPGEGFGDFCQRLGPEALRALPPASAHGAPPLAPLAK